MSIHIRKINKIEENILAVLCFARFTELFRYFDDVYLEFETKILECSNEDNNSDTEVEFFPKAFITTNENEKYIALDSRLFSTEYGKSLLPFVYLHELFHGKLKHMLRFKKYFEKNSMLANEAVDLFINEIILPYFSLPENFVKQIVSLNSINNRHSVNVFGRIIIPSTYELFDKDKMHEYSDEDIMRILFENFENLFEKIENMINNAIENSKNSASSSENSNSDSNKSQNNDDENSENSNGNNSIKKFESILKDIEKQFNDAMKNDSDFKNSVEKFSSVGNIERNIIEEILKRLTGNNNNYESNEGKSENAKENIRKIIEYIDSNGKYKSSTGSLLRKFFSEKKKFSKIGILANYLNRLEKYGHLKQKLMYPNKKFSNTKIVMPKRKFVGGELSIIIDTSGSMSDKDISIIGAYTKYLLNNGIVCRLYFNDTSFKEIYIDSVSKLNKIKDIVGGGGSVFSEVFKYVKKKQEFGILYSDLYIDGLEYLPNSFLVIASNGYDVAAYNKLKNKGYIVYTTNELE